MLTADVPKQINDTPEWYGPDYQWTTGKRFGVFTQDIPPKLQRDYDSAWKLEQLGLKIVGTDRGNECYTVELPEGSAIEVSGYATDIYLGGVKVASCFDKWASYDPAHHVTFLV